MSQSTSSLCQDIACLSTLTSREAIPGEVWFVGLQGSRGKSDLEVTFYGLGKLSFLKHERVYLTEIPLGMLKDLNVEMVLVFFPPCQG